MELTAGAGEAVVTFGTDRTNSSPVPMAFPKRPNSRRRISASVRQRIQRCKPTPTKKKKKKKKRKAAELQADSESNTYSCCQCQMNFTEAMFRMRRDRSAPMRSKALGGKVVCNRCVWEATATVFCVNCNQFHNVPTKSERIPVQCGFDGSNRQRRPHVCHALFCAEHHIYHIPNSSDKPRLYGLCASLRSSTPDLIDDRRDVPNTPGG